MYVYIRAERGVFEVGFYVPDGVWNPESAYPTPEEAARRVHYLNGGYGE